MTKVYCVRHALPDVSIKDDLTRPLTEEGLNDSKKVTTFLLDKEITQIYSSPYKRAIDTIKDFANKLNLEITVIDDFRERKIDNVWIEDFNAFAKEQWNNFDYKLSAGESLHEVQKRNVTALHRLLENHTDEQIVIGTHGTALSTIINYYNRKFDFSEFERIKHLMPFIVCLTFENQDLVSIEEYMIG